LDAALGCHGGDVIDDLLRSLGTTKFLGVGIDHRARLAQRGCRVELERAEDDADIDLVGELGDGRLEATLADVTPRADDIRPDLDLDVGAHVLDDRPVSWRP
jgi:hypothetical protein